MGYADFSWHRPYGSDGERGREGLGFGAGTGTITGDVLRGTVVWANYPRRREDGVWTPNLRGFVRTDEGSELLFAIHGQSVEEQGPRLLRAILARLEFTTGDPAYSWLNTCFVVGEGEIDEDTQAWWLDAFVCVNERAVHPPAVGAEPPARFRQGTWRQD